MYRSTRWSARTWRGLWEDAPDIWCLWWKYATQRLCSCRKCPFVQIPFGDRKGPILWFPFPEHLKDTRKRTTYQHGPIGKSDYGHSRRRHELLVPSQNERPCSWNPYTVYGELEVDARLEERGGRSSDWPWDKQSMFHRRRLFWDVYIGIWCGVGWDEGFRGHSGLVASRRHCLSNSTKGS